MSEKFLKALVGVLIVPLMASLLYTGRMLEKVASMKEADMAMVVTMEKLNAKIDSHKKEMDSHDDTDLERYWQMLSRLEGVEDRCARSLARIEGMEKTHKPTAKHIFGDMNES